MAKDNNQLLFGKYVLGKQSVVGNPQRKWEDRVYAALIERQNDEPLLVGIVADGVGSADLGARGAQLAIDTVLGNLRQSQGDDIPALIEQAMEAANHTVYAENQAKDGDGLSTLVVMVTYKDRCYVGNVGDSRAYWIRGGKKKLLQLTRDHSYYNIYGGDPQADNAGHVVNAIGLKPEVQVDLGFYLETGIEKEKAYRLGYAGVPLQPGDTIMLCSDGLIKNSPQGEPYTTPEEIIEAAISEYEPDRAAIKMVSHVEGRRPDDNVSAVTLQYLTPEIIAELRSKSEQAKRRKTLARMGAVMFAVAAIALIGLLGFKLTNQETEKIIVTVEISSSPMPTMTATQPIDPGKARVEHVYGSGANVSDQQELQPGSQVSSGDGGIRMLVGEQTGRAGVLFLFEQSAMQLEFTEKMKPVLQSGAIFIQPGSGSAEVYFSSWPELKAIVEGSRMIVEIQGEDIWVYCFEGTCQLRASLKSEYVPVGSKKVYHTATSTWEDAIPMTNEEMWDWNQRCYQCLFDVVPLTPTPTVVRYMPTEKKDKGNGQSTPVPPVVKATQPLITKAPSTKEPPATEPPATEPPATNPPGPGNTKEPKPTKPTSYP